MYPRKYIQNQTNSFAAEGITTYFHSLFVLGSGVAYRIGIGPASASFTLSNDISSEAAWPIKIKFHLKHLSTAGFSGFFFYEN